MGIAAIIAVFLVSCSSAEKFKSREQKVDNVPVVVNKYGAYLAGRVAHLRKDFENASNYYKVAVEQVPNNKKMINQLYLLLASQGKIDEAFKYAQDLAIEGEKVLFAHLIIAAKKMYDGDYSEVIRQTNKINNSVQDNLLVPILKSWAYAGLEDKEKAKAELNKLKKEKEFSFLYRYNYAILLDYIGENEEAQQMYESILEDKNAELSLRMLEIITNFYIRSGQKDRAEAIFDAAKNNPALDTLLSILKQKVVSSKNSSVEPILHHPRIGVAESIFSVVSALNGGDMVDVVHMYTALTIYLNPDYSTAKILMADIFEVRGMYDSANKIYDNIDKNDIAYYPSKIKKARNFIKTGNYAAAEQLLRNLSQEYKDVQIYIDLGDALRMQGKFADAVKVYDEAISATNNKSTLWVLYYAKGIALERLGKWKDAEKTLMAAYKIKDHYLVLNYLGYTWMMQKQNIEKALDFIVQAYNQAPNDPSINDSLGYALYNLGYYAMALPYLEKAVEYYPSSAIISSHLGDAYWSAKRYNEAKFQWMHSLKLKDELGELNVKETKAKIENGLSDMPVLDFDQEKVDNILKKIKKKSIARKI